MNAWIRQCILLRLPCEGIRNRRQVRRYAIEICNLSKQTKRFKCERWKKVTKYKYVPMHLKELRKGKLLGRRHLKLKKFGDVLSWTWFFLPELRRTNSTSAFFFFTSSTLGWNTKLKNYEMSGSGGGSVGRGVASDTKGRRFESYQRQIFIYQLQLNKKDKSKGKRGREWPIFVQF